MGLCKCPKRKVTNLFCFEHDVNVCEDCLVSDHERCIVQSYVQWLQDSEYNPICTLCKNLLKDEPTIRLACYDVFHWSCLDKYAQELSANTAPAGYQCPKCKEGIFPPSNIVSPVVDILKRKLETTNWSRVGLGQSLLNIKENLNIDEQNNNEIEYKEEKINIANSPEDEANGFIIVNEHNKKTIVDEKSETSQNTLKPFKSSTKVKSNVTETSTNDINKNTAVNFEENRLKNFKSSDDKRIDSFEYGSHNRTLIAQSHEITSNLDTSYDPSLGIVLNINNLDRDTGEYKYQRRPVTEWFSRWLKSRQFQSKMRMTRQKKYLFIIILIFLGFFTLILIMTRLGQLSTESDPAFDPLNNPNIHVE